MRRVCVHPPGLAQAPAAPSLGRQAGWLAGWHALAPPAITPQSHAHTQSLIPSDPPPPKTTQDVRSFLDACAPALTAVLVLEQRGEDLQALATLLGLGGSRWVLLFGIIA